MTTKLPEALADALGRVIAEKQQQWRRELDRMAAEHRAVVAELRAENTELRAEIKAAIDSELERVPAVLANVKDGAPGKDADEELIFQRVAERIDDKLASIPIPQDGKDGKDADEELILQSCRVYIDEKIALIPVPKDGKDGEDGKDADEELIFQMLCERVDDKFSSIPIPKDGKDGIDGKDGVDGQDGAPGKDGADGKDGKDGASGRDGRDGLDATSFIRDAGGGLVAVMSDGSIRDLGKIVGEPGQDGKDGLDGVGFDDLEFVMMDDERTLMILARRGENVKEWVFHLNHVLDRGVYQEGTTYSKGDGVTWAGSFWIAQQETSDKPDRSKSWRLAVKRGKDGKDGRDGELKEPKEPVKVK